MERKTLFLVLIALMANLPLFAQNIYHEEDLVNGAIIPAGQNEFWWNEDQEHPDRILTISGGDLTVNAGATITFVGVELLEFTNGRTFDCNGTDVTQENTRVTFLGFAEDPGGGEREIDGDEHPVAIDMQNGSTADINHTQFQWFGVALEAQAGSNVNIDHGTFEECDIAVRDQTNETQLNYCVFDQFWISAVQADGATGFDYIDCDFNSADVDGPVEVGLLTANHIICEDCDDECLIQDCSFDQIHGGHLPFMRASIRLLNSSPMIKFSTFNYDEINNGTPTEHIDVSVEVEGNSDPILYGCRSVGSPKIHVMASEDHITIIDSCYFEYFPRGEADDCAVIIEDGQMVVKNCYMIDCELNVVFVDNGNAIPCGGSVTNCLFIYSGKYWQSGFEFIGIQVNEAWPNRILDLEISNNVFFKQGLSQPNEGLWHGVELFLPEELESKVNLRNNIFYDEDNLDCNEEIGVQGNRVDFNDGFNYFYQIENPFVDAGQVDQSNVLEGDDPDFVEPPFTGITFENEQDRTYNVYLDFDSPCIDIGDPNADYIDLNFTFNDVGIYGGPLTVGDMIEEFFGTVIAQQHHVEVSGTVPRNYTYTVNAGTTMEFDAGTRIYVNGDLNVNGIAANPAVFTSWDWDQGGRWSGIDFGGTGGHNSTLNFAHVSRSDWFGIGINGTWVNSINNCSIYLNDQYGIIVWWGDGPTTITNCNIFENGTYGIYIGIEWESETVFIGAEGAGNIISNNGLYGLYVTDNDFQSADNVYQYNGFYGVWVWRDSQSEFDGDRIVRNGAVGGGGAGIGFQNAVVPVLIDTWSRNNLHRGMECWGASFVDIAPMDPSFNSFENNGWWSRELEIPMQDVEEIYLYRDSDVLMCNGHNDIADDRFEPVLDIVMSRFPNFFGQIDGISNYFGNPMDPADVFDPFNLVINFNQPFGWVDDLNEERIANGLIARALGNFREDDYEAALEIMREIISDYPDTRAAANIPLMMLRCVRKLDLDLERTRTYLLDWEIEDEDSPGRHINQCRILLTNVVV